MTFKALFELPEWSLAESSLCCDTWDPSSNYVHWVISTSEPKPQILQRFHFFSIWFSLPCVRFWLLHFFFLCLSLSAAFVLSCVFPQRPLYGDVSVSSLHSGGEAFFSCLSGYQLHGPSVLTCRNASTPYWSGKEPHCLGERKRGETTSILEIEGTTHKSSLLVEQ